MLKEIIVSILILRSYYQNQLIYRACFNHGNLLCPFLLDCGIFTAFQKVIHQPVCQQNKVKKQQHIVCIKEPSEEENKNRPIREKSSSWQVCILLCTQDVYLLLSSFRQIKNPSLLQHTHKHKQVRMHAHMQNRKVIHHSKFLCHSQLVWIRCASSNTCCLFCIKETASLFCSFSLALIFAFIKPLKPKHLQYILTVSSR